MNARSIVESQSSASEMSAELSHIDTSAMFRQWLLALDQNEEANVTLKVDTEMLTNGYCEDLAAYLHYKYGAQVTDLDSPELPPKFGHYFVELGGKFYDALNPQGVGKPSDLTYFKRLIELYPVLTPDRIEKHLSR